MLPLTLALRMFVNRRKQHKSLYYSPTDPGEVLITAHGEKVPMNSKEIDWFSISNTLIFSPLPNKSRSGESSSVGPTKDPLEDFAVPRGGGGDRKTTVVGMAGSLLICLLQTKNSRQSLGNTNLLPVRFSFSL